MPVEKLSVSLSPDIMGQINTRAEGNVSGAINKSLARYFALLQRSLAELRSQLSEPECSLILDATNGSAFSDTISLNMLWADIEDAVNLDGLDQKWGVDGRALVAKIKLAGMAGQTALIDASERWWNRVSAEENPGYAELLTA